jgi:processive 1,2-diacylglycerol beta-glucosyltransferase
MKRIIAFYISDAGGHNKAAENIREAFEYKDPKVKVLKINALGYFYPRGEKVVDFTYLAIIKHFPQIWKTIYDRRDVIRSLTPVQKFFNKIAFRKLSKLIKDFRPDCFIATQAFPCGVTGDFKEKFGCKIPLIAVVTDYYPHRFWIHDAINKYTVASLEAKKLLVRQGVPEEKIKILGIPISVKFLTSYPRKAIAHELGVSGSLPAVLLMGGGLGIGPIKKIAKELDRLPFNFQTIVICGRNKRLYKWFVRNKRKFKKAIYPFGYVEFVHKLMDFCDIIITKPGGVTVSEALSKGMAIVITTPIPGQEERNVKYLLKKGVIVKGEESGSVSEAVSSFLSDKKKMYVYKERAKEISRIDSSLRIVDLILEEIV